MRIKNDHSLVDINDESNLNNDFELLGEPEEFKDVMDKQAAQRMEAYDWFLYKLAPKLTYRQALNLVTVPVGELRELRIRRIVIAKERLSEDGVYSWEQLEIPKQK